jgi:hypothetical protein
MDNHNLLYSDSEESSEEDDNQNSFLIKENNIKYDINKTQILIDTNNREWVNSFKSIFDFQVRFNASETSIEDIRTTYLKHITNEYGSKVSIYDEKSEIITFQGSNSLSIPITIKNIKSVYLDRILIPNRKIYYNEGYSINLLDIPFLSIIIDEFSNSVYGTNSNLTSSFANMISTSTIYPSSTTIQKFIELKNITKNPKIFKPVPLNNLNTMTIKIKDNLGKQLKFRNEKLEIQSMEYESSTGTVINKYFIKITTSSYFSRLEYQEDDIIIFKDINTEDNLLKKFLEKEIGHKIYFNTDYTEKNNLGINNDLINIFYINNELNQSSGNYSVDSLYENFIFTSISGNILNKNLQLIMYFTIENVEKSFENSMNYQIL